MAVLYSRAGLPGPDQLQPPLESQETTEQVDARPVDPNEQQRRRRNRSESEPGPQWVQDLIQQMGLTNKRARNAPEEGFVAYVTRTLLVVPIYPLRLVQVLVQMGYEVSPPERRYSYLFRQYMYYYPGLYGYAKRIVAQDGWKAIYCGVSSWAVSEIISLTARGFFAPLVKKGVDKLPLTVVASNGDVPDNEANIETTRAVLVRATRFFLNSILLKATVQFITHPFHVVSIRIATQYIGKETIYRNVLQSLREIYQEEGIAGFFSGIIPVLIGHVFQSLMYVSLMVFFDILIMNIPTKTTKLLVRGLIEAPLLHYIPRTYSYPFFLASNMMAVNNCHLKAGLPPMMPRFNGWTDCFRYLKSSRLLYRGSVVILPRFAYKTPPALT